MQQKAHQLLRGKTPRHQNSTHSRLRPHFRPFFDFDDCQQEVVSDVIYGVVVEPAGVKVRVKFGDSRSNSSRDIRLPHFVRPTTTTTTTPAYACHHIRARIFA